MSLFKYRKLHFRNLKPISYVLILHLYETWFGIQLQPLSIQNKPLIHSCLCGWKRLLKSCEHIVACEHCNTNFTPPPWYVICYYLTTCSFSAPCKWCNTDIIWWKFLSLFVASCSGLLWLIIATFITGIIIITTTTEYSKGKIPAIALWADLWT